MMNFPVSLDMNYYTPIRYNAYNPYNPCYYPPIGYGMGMYGGYYSPYYMNYGMLPRYTEYYPNLLL